ncbi:hypothetical protein AGMMS49959_15290 [Planctomycetales bacterium]|nr:hypothetical protein AGMMS49959_15290 [Planctomycetales bacterium]
MFAKAKIVGTLTTYPQQGRNYHEDGMSYVLVEVAQDERVPDKMLRMRQFKWREGSTYNGQQKMGALQDKIGGYCIWLSDLKELGDTKPGDVVEVNAVLIPVCIAKQERDERGAPTGNLYNSPIPEMRFFIDGVLKRAAEPVRTPHLSEGKK